MRALVTGGAGFIGSHLVDRLVAEGHDTTVIDNLSTGRRSNLEAAEATSYCRLVVMDVADPQVARLFAETKPDVVFHLAAEMDERKSTATHLNNTRTNVLGTVNILESAVHARVDKLVFASSGGVVYGEPDRVPVRENAPLRPTSPHGAAKVAGETYVKAFGALHALRWTSLALGNVYGPRQDPHSESGVVAIFGTAMLEGRPTVIYGDGRSSRDYVHVADAVDAFMACVNPRTDGRRFNIGTSAATTISALHAMIADACNVPDEPELKPERLGELRRIALDPTAFAAVTGWRPRVPLAEGLADTVSWIASSLGLESPVAGGRHRLEALSPDRIEPYPDSAGGARRD